MIYQPKKIFDAQATAAVSPEILAADFRHIVFHFRSAGSVTAQVKIRASLQADCDIDAAASATNRWVYVATTDLEAAGSAVAGNTGYSVTAAVLDKMIEVESNALYKVAAEIVSTNGAITCEVFMREADGR
jgi:hypothetical protein